MKKDKKTWILWGCLTAALLAAIVLVCVHMFRKEAEDRKAVDRELAQMTEQTAEQTENTATSSSETGILLDGEKVSSIPVMGGTEEPTRVIVYLGNYMIADLPFGEPHTLRINQPLGQNTIRITTDAVFMEDADCHGQDCVGMGEVTRDNLETRVMGGFIICLPHQVSVEVREP